jgi:ligand-binding SRPBCC domain-containing protein
MLVEPVKGADLVKRSIAPGFLIATLLAGAFISVPLTTQADSSGAIAKINTECNAIQNAVMALHPIHVAYRSGNWIVLSDADATVAMRTKVSVRFADVYKQGSNYAWVHAHTFDSQGNQRATQLCFRQSDGTLERVRQATTIPALAEASAQQAFYTSDGKVIQKTSLFEQNDPMIAKAISSLPFYNVLPK